MNCAYSTVSNGTYCDGWIIPESIYTHNIIKFMLHLLECGLTNIAPNLKIVGGINANPYSWPSQVLVVQNIALDYSLSSNLIIPVQQQVIIKTSFKYYL